MHEECATQTPKINYLILYSIKFRPKLQIKNLRENAQKSSIELMKHLDFLYSLS